MSDKGKNNSKGVPKKKGKSSKNKTGKSKGNVEKKKVATSVSPAGKNANGVRQNVMILATVDTQAAIALPCALVSMAYTRGFLKSTESGIMYWAYIGFMEDVIAIMQQQTTKCYGRLQYLNGILASLLPKSVPFKTGTISYSWGNADAIPADNSDISVRTYNFYLYEPGTALNGSGWLIQVPPTTPPGDSSNQQALSKLYTILGDNSRAQTKYIQDISFLPDYMADVSAYGQVSAYYGNGNSSSSSSASSSIDNEVPFNSLIAATFSPYNVSNGRVGGFYRRGSGDSTFFAGAGLAQAFDYMNYKTVYPPVYCFIDIDEISTMIMWWYYELVQKGLQALTADNVGVQTEFILALEPFNITAQTFRIIITQVIKSYFADEVSLTQFMSYSNAPGGFEAVRCGSNCYPPQEPIQLTLPNYLVENMRMLKMKGYTLPTKYQNQKNKLFYVPVFGFVRSAPAPNISIGSFFSGDTPVSTSMFLPPIPSDPNAIDGTDSQDNVCDLNATPIVSEFIKEWNQRVALLSQFSVSLGRLEGSSNGCLLPYTRFCQYQSVNRELTGVSKILKRRLDPGHIVRKPVKQHSKKELKGENNPNVFAEFYVPPNAALGSQFTVAYSALPTITEDTKNLMNYFILPTTILEPGNVPTQQQARVATFENNVFDIPTTENSLASRLSEIITMAAAGAPGTAAGDNDEMASILKTMNKMGKGGFLGSVLGALGPILPF